MEVLLKMVDSMVETGRFDLHVHTFFSRDSLLDPRLLPKVAASRGLAGLAVTDHNFFGAHRMLESSSLIVVPGMEIRTSAGDIIVLFIQEPVLSRDPLEVYELVKKQDGILIAAHPFGFPRLSSMIEEFTRLLDGVEVVNSRNLFRRQNQKALELARRLGKAETGGSDAHTLYEVGKAYTLAAASSLEELRAAIRSRMTKGSGGLSIPLVHLASFSASIVHKLARRPPFF
ncbi:MAG: PHP domain-containing protein [Thaumarchaeota archaeon]|nr:PHP domain-containing protein [Nitrososphaerota archaeon]